MSNDPVTFSQVERGDTFRIHPDERGIHLDPARHKKGVVYTRVSTFYAQKEGDTKRIGFPMHMRIVQVTED